MAYSIDLSGRVAFVTGASSGLGAQFARTLARAGAGVVLASRRVDKLKELRARIEGEGGDAHVVELDVTDYDSIKSAVAHAETEMGSIDILVNNSGVSTTQRLQDVTPDDYDYIFDTNVKGAFFVALEWGRFGINVNALCPGYIDTEINHDHWRTEQGQKLVAMLPRKRVGQPQDLDALIVMLASDQSHFVNGAVIAADDGFAV